MSGEQRETGRIPRTMECHLTSDLCDSCVPGDTVAVTAIVRVANESKEVAKTPMLQPDWLVEFAVGLSFLFRCSYSQRKQGSVYVPHLS